ncbi:alpha/beta hydrolase family protein [Paenibacillus eucommiae]|uniref:Dienelactone hydrolase n=1 Tax=Paenibacillus eucommiae TaxID=1355755 RepID=A0ABS4ILU7_9BACL|nr:CocE/NonD family hydrolase [Paenibacillus eucommiae]MBP1988548.1 dienelactone hydrolase [Paenibacillus eucommiae]
MNMDFTKALTSMDKTMKWDMELLEMEETVEHSIRKLYVNTVLLGEPIQIFVIYGTPINTERVPAVLHIHGGGQTADVKHVKHWVKRGYASVSYDWTGPWGDRTQVSTLGGLPDKLITDGLSPMQLMMLTRVVVAKTIVKWMKQQAEIQSDHIGAYGISWGGAITWLLNRYESGLRAVAPIYGCGGHFRTDRSYGNASVPHTAKERFAGEQWLDGIQVAAKQQSPLLMIAATNDDWGWMDAVEEALVRINQVTWSLTTSVNQNHHLDEWTEVTLNAWMDHHLRGKVKEWPRLPEIQLEVREGNGLYARVIPDAVADAVADANAEGNPSYRLCWSWADYSEVPPPSRYWNVAPLSSGTSDGIHELRVPVVNPQTALYIYADAIYPNGMKISGLPLRALPQQLGMQQADDVSSDVLADFQEGNDGWYCPIMWTEPIDAEFRYDFVPDPQGGRGVALPDFQGLYHWTTFKCVDPKWQSSPEHMGLSFRFYAATEGDWVCKAIYRTAVAGERRWAYNVSLTQGWNTIDVPFKQLRDEAGNPLPGSFFIQSLLITFQEQEPDKAVGKSALGSVQWVK